MKRCVYCLDNGALRADQILLYGDAMYACAPRGPLVEGFAAIAPYACVGSLSRLRDECFAELEEMIATLGRFYSDSYGCAHWLLYEQGRGGGGLAIDPQDGFPIHTHVCALPLDLDLAPALTRRFRSIPIANAAALPATVDGPYLYVERRDRDGRSDAHAYLANSPETRSELESSRLRPLVAALAGTPERGDWRDYPGDVELEAAIARFGDWRRVSGVPRR